MRFIILGFFQKKLANLRRNSHELIQSISNNLSIFYKSKQELFKMEHLCIENLLIGIKQKKILEKISLRFQDSNPRNLEKILDFQTTIEFQTRIIMTSLHLCEYLLAEIPESSIPKFSDFQLFSIGLTR